MTKSLLLLICLFIYNYLISLIQHACEAILDNFAVSAKNTSNSDYVVMQLNKVNRVGLFILPFSPCAKIATRA